MNNLASASNLPMSDIGRALASKECEIHLKQLNNAIDQEIAKVERSQRTGLDKAAYELSKEQIRALHSAKVILKSISLFHSF